MLEGLGLSITDSSAIWIQWCRAKEEIDILTVNLD